MTKSSTTFNDDRGRHLFITEKWRRRTAIEMAITGLIGLFASFNLSIEAWKLAENSGASFSCDINTVLSCSAVAMTPQARVLGFPNAFLGILFESIVLAISCAMIAGVKFPRWYMLGAEALYTIGLLFALWLFSQSYFVIHVLCPWCLLITLTTVLVWAGLTRINVAEGNIPVPEAWRRFVSMGTDWAITFLIIFIIIAAVIVRYGATLLG